MFLDMIMLLVCNKEMAAGQLACNQGKIQAKYIYKYTYMIIYIYINVKVVSDQTQHCRTGPLFLLHIGKSTCLDSLEPSDK